MLLLLLFSGLIYCLASLGVAAGYMGGGQFLSLYVDIGAVDINGFAIRISITQFVWRRF